MADMHNSSNAGLNEDLPRVQADEADDVAGLNQIMLQKLVALMDRDAFENLVHSFLSRTEDYIAQISAFIDDKDREQVQFVAHTVKGSCANMGCEKLSALFAELENQARTDQDIRRLSRDIVAVRQQFTISKTALMSFLENSVLT